MPRKQLNRLNMHTRFALLKRLEEVLETSIDPKTQKKASVYKKTADGAPINDVTIAKELDIQENIVAGNRREVFGNFPQSLRHANRLAKKEDLMNQIEELRSRIRFIEQQLGIDGESNNG